MPISVNLYDKGQAAPKSTLNSTLAWLGVSSGGTANTVYSFSSSGIVGQTVGYGPGAEGVAAGCRISQQTQLFVPVNASIAGSNGTVTQSGTSPLITLSGAPYDSYDASLVITKGGTQGAAASGSFQVAMDGGTYGGQTDVPSPTSAAVVGSVSTGAWTSTNYTALNTLTLIVTPTTGGAKTVTFAATTAANFLTQINTTLAATATASLVGGGYLKIVDASSGSTSTITVGSGTANTLLGLTAGAVTGAAATYTIPNSGITVTFPAGTYNINETYTWHSTEPRFAATDLAAALLALQNSNIYFRDIVVLSTPVDGMDTRGLAVQLSTSVATMRASTPKIFAEGCMGAAIGLSSAIATNDADIKLAMAGSTLDPYVTLTHGDCFMSGTAISGSFRRPAIYSLGIRMAAYSLSSDPGDHELPVLDETSMVGPNLTTVARDENTATTKMQTQGFTVLTNEAQVPYFVQGVTRGTSPKFQYLAIMRTALECCRVLYTNGRRYQNAKRFLAANGTLRPADADAIKTFLDNAMIQALERDISGAVTTVDTSSNVAVTNTLNIGCDVQALGYFFQVNINVGIVNVLDAPAS